MSSAWLSQLSHRVRAAAAAGQEAPARRRRRPPFRAAEIIVPILVLALVLLCCWSASTRRLPEPTTKAAAAEAAAPSGIAAAEVAGSGAAAVVNAAQAGASGAGAEQADAAGADAAKAAISSGSDGRGSEGCPVPYERLTFEEVASRLPAPGVRRPYLFGAPSRPGCANCERADNLYSNFCQFKSHGPVCKERVWQGIVASWVDRRYELPLTMTPCDLWAHIRGRTLLLIGDSMMLDFFKAAACFMFEFWPSLEPEPLSANATLQEQLACSTVLPRCAQLLDGTRVCYARQDKGEDYHGKSLPLLLSAGLVSSRDILVANFGLHHGDVAGYKKLAGDFVAYYKQHADRLPRLFWQQTSAQHFDTAAGEYGGGKPPFTCKPVAGYSVSGNGTLVLQPGRTDKAGVLKGLWRNAAADPIMQAAGIPIIHSFNESLPLWEAHRDNGQGWECTHYCHPSAPQMWVAQLVRALRQDRRAVAEGSPG